jgi:hypothetical protein
VSAWTRVTAIVQQIALGEITAKGDNEVGCDDRIPLSGGIARLILHGAIVTGL